MDELEITFEIEDLKYGKIKRCLYRGKIVYMLEDKIIEDENIIQELEVKYGFKLSDNLKNIDF